MITITPRAAEQIRKSAAVSQAEGMPLRIAVRLEEDGRFDYGLGFDEQAEGDLRFTSEGIDVLVAAGMKALLDGAVLDYVELNPGEFRFIVINPNDPAHSKPQEPGGLE